MESKKEGKKETAEDVEDNDEMIYSKEEEEEIRKRLRALGYI